VIFDFRRQKISLTPKSYTSMPPLGAFELLSEELSLPTMTISFASEDASILRIKLLR
jgi:hypothetical protein